MHGPAPAAGAGVPVLVVQAGHQRDQLHAQRHAFILARHRPDTLHRPGQIHGLQTLAIPDLQLPRTTAHRRTPERHQHRPATAHDHMLQRPAAADVLVTPLQIPGRGFALLILGVLAQCPDQRLALHGFAQRTPDFGLSRVAQPAKADRRNRLELHPAIALMLCAAFNAADDDSDAGAVMQALGRWRVQRHALQNLLPHPAQRRLRTLITVLRPVAIHTP